MKITISQRKRADIMPDMMGLFFEDINYATVMGIRQIIILNLTDCMAGNVIRKRKMPECGVSWEARLRKKIRII